jgi:hypothetical protein
MRCIICGRESLDGVWTSDGFVCQICKDSYNFQPCSSCGIFFKANEMELIKGDFYCKDCAKKVPKIPKIAKPKKPARAGGRVFVKLPEEEILPENVEKKAEEILERKKSFLANFFGFLGNFVRGKKRG